MKRLGHVLFAIGLAGLGILSLRFDDFALNWQPVPTGVPFQAFLAYASGAILLAGGAGMFARRAASWSTLGLTIFVLTWLLFLQFPRVAANPLNEGAWLGFGENLVLAAGGWTLFACLSRHEGRPLVKFAGGEAGLRLGQLLFGVSLPLIGLSHFIYVDATAAMVPGWLPARVGLAYLTGAAHIAAGIGLILRIVPWLAATLEAIMLSLFVLLLHMPGVAAAPESRLQWTMLFVASALTGASWAVAGSLAETRAAQTPRTTPHRHGH
jgi:uncharacterized membrane protein